GAHPRALPAVARRRLHHAAHGAAERGGDGADEQDRARVIEATGAEATSVRARAKDERRTRIVKAAAKLLAEREDGSFSMQELAARANLSPATPYNLFGTKAAILQEVFRIETEGFQRHYAVLRQAPPVERVLGTVDQILSVYVRKPRFF